MDISLIPPLQKFVEEQVRSGRYSSAEELINGAVATLQSQHEALTPQEVEELRREVAIGIAEADRGDFVEFTAQDIIAEGRQRLAKRLKSKRQKAR